MFDSDINDPEIPIPGWDTKKEAKDSDQNPIVQKKISDDINGCGTFFLKNYLPESEVKINNEIIRNIKKNGIGPLDIRIIFPMDDQWTRFVNQRKVEYSDRIIFSIFCPNREDVIASYLTWADYPVDSLGSQMNGIETDIPYECFFPSFYSLNYQNNNPGWIVFALSLKASLTKSQWEASLLSFQKSVKEISSGIKDRNGLTKKQYAVMMSFAKKLNSQEEGDDKKQDGQELV